jgi:hypothetical protein
MEDATRFLKGLPINVITERLLKILCVRVPLLRL